MNLVGFDLNWKLLNKLKIWIQNKFFIHVKLWF